MLYLIGLGLNAYGISKEGLDIVKRCKRIYLENYTVDFPYPITELEDIIGKKVISADREKVESLEIVDEAEEMEVALLIYGSPLTATTHISLIQEAKALEIKYKIIYNASIKAHSLILCDIGLDFEEAINQLKKSAENCKFELRSEQKTGNFLTNSPSGKSQIKGK